MRLYASLIVLGILSSAVGMAQVSLPSGNADLGVQINAAAASMPNNGGKILLQSQANGQCYVFRAPIVITKAVILQGEGHSTCLSFAGSGTAITFAGGSNNLVPWGSYVDGFGLRDLTLLGSGPSGNQTGLLLGGTTNRLGSMLPRLQSATLASACSSAAASGTSRCSIPFLA